MKGSELKKFKPYIAGSGEFFINNTKYLGEELKSYDRDSDKLLLLKKAISEFDHMNNLYQDADPISYLAV